MRARRYDMTATQPSEKDRLVICALHNSRRLIKFCIAKPVYNADRVIVDYTYECREESRCGASASRDNFSKQPFSRNAIDTTNAAISDQPVSLGLLPQTAAVSTVSDADSAQQQQRAGVGRGFNRYYDLANQRGADGGWGKKICWNCGMGGHEKPTCPNVLCPTCHCPRGYHHVCQEPRVSPFIEMSSNIYFLKDMEAVECVYCSSLGHFDCSTGHDLRIPSCCFCGEMGHNAYDCHQRKGKIPDRWVSRGSGSKQNQMYKRNRAVYSGVSSNHVLDVRGAFKCNGIQAMSVDGGAISSSDFCYTNTKGGIEAQKRDHRGGEYHVTDYRFLHTGTGSYHASHKNNYNTAHGPASGHRSQRGEKRLRCGDDEKSHHHRHGRASSNFQGSVWAAEKGCRGGKANTGDGLGEWGRERGQRQSHNSGSYYQTRHHGRRRGKGDNGDDYDLF